MDTFVTDAMLLSGLLDQAHNGVLQLPDFQRGWVWDDSHIQSLLASVSLSYPIGALMTLRSGNPHVRFKPRLLEGVAAATANEPEVLLLDGQQRTTSLYQALRSGAPVATRDGRGKDMSRRYFADILACLDPHADREEAIVSVPADGLVTTFRGDVILDVSTREAQVAASMFPLEIVLDSSATTHWQLEFLAEPTMERLQTWMAFDKAIVQPFNQYRVPTIELTRSTQKEAVCQVFEKVNTGGVSLTVFELLTATYAADDFSLRDDWGSREAVLAEHPLLGGFKATDLLQIITLLSTRDRRVRYLADRPDDERAPAISCKRREVLRLEVEDYRRWADMATATLPRAVAFLRREGVFAAADLPYSTQLVPLTTILAVLGDRADDVTVAVKLRQWYWCGVFGELYGGSTETRIANDVQDVLAWVDGGAEPRTVADSQFQASRLLTLRTRNSAAYKGLYVQQLKRGVLDFRTGTAIDSDVYVEGRFDIDYIFPKRWFGEHKISVGDANSIVNKTVIDARTGRRMRSFAPSAYLTHLAGDTHLEPDTLDTIVRSHDIDPLALRSDDFAAFFTARFEALLQQIEAATGKPANRSASDNPYADADLDADQAAEAVRRVIAAKESTVVEFKSTCWKNLKTGLLDNEMEWAVLKTIAAFLNTRGGTLLVGVADHGATVGIEEDYSVMGAKKNTDGWELRLIDALNRSLGKPAATDVGIGYVDLDGRTVVRVTVRPAAQAVFATPGKGEKKPTFFVRINSSTHELVGHELLSYQKQRWPS